MSDELNGSNGGGSHVSVYHWAVRASAIAFEMVFPAVVGVGLDRLFGTVALFAILGVILGMALAFWHLIRLANSEL